ncbi:unnamed protein product, partial [Dibothriocephalus latus]
MAAETTEHEGSPAVAWTADDFSVYASPDGFVNDGLGRHQRADLASEWSPLRLLTAFEEVRRSFSLAGPTDLCCD